MMRHPSTRTLARYSAGAFGVRKVARVTAHLAGCARCSGTSTDLTTVSDLLAKMAPTESERIRLVDEANAHRARTVW